jgi:hypothetical protein
MMNNFRYRNTSGLEITSEEALQIGEFTESEWLEERHLFDRIYKDFQLQYTIHYLQFGETHTEIINENVGRKFVIEQIVEESGEFRVLENFEYDSFGNIRSKSFRVLDQYNRVICSGYLDPFTNQILKVEKFKYNDLGKRSFIFLYSSNGELSIIIDELDDFGRHYTPDEIGNNPDLKFNMVGNEYYMKATTILPQGAFI